MEECAIILYIYKGGLCDPTKNIGVARKFPTSKDLDDYVEFFAASIKPEAMHNYKAYVANDEVDFEAIDHYVLFNDYLNIGDSVRIKEVPLSGTLSIR